MRGGVIRTVGETQKSSTDRDAASEAPLSAPGERERGERVEHGPSLAARGGERHLFRCPSVFSTSYRRDEGSSANDAGPLRRRGSAAE